MIDTDATLNPLTSYDPTARLNQDIYWQKVWRTAYYTSVVGSAAICVVTFFITRRFYPSITLQVMGMIPSLGFPISSTVTNKIWEKAESYRKNAEFNDDLKGRVEKMEPEQFDKILGKLVVSKDLDESAQKILIAHYEYCENRSEGLKEKAEYKEQISLSIGLESLTVEHSDYEISKVDFNDQDQASIYKEIQKHDRNSQDDWYNASLYHLNAAYYLHLIQNPYEERQSYQDFVDLIELTPTERYQAEVVNKDPNAWAILKTKTEKLLLTSHQILDTTTTQLVKNIFQDTAKT